MGGSDITVTLRINNDFCKQMERTQIDGKGNLIDCYRINVNKTESNKAGHINQAIFQPTNQS